MKRREGKRSRRKVKEESGREEKQKRGEPKRRGREEKRREERERSKRKMRRAKVSFFGKKLPFDEFDGIDFSADVFQETRNKLFSKKKKIRKIPKKVKRKN